MYNKLIIEKALNTKNTMRTVQSSITVLRGYYI